MVDSDSGTDSVRKWWIIDRRHISPRESFLIYFSTASETILKWQKKSSPPPITIIRWVWAASWYWIQILFKVSLESNLKIYQNWASLRIPLKQRFEMFVLSVWKYLERIFPELAPGRRLHKPPTPHSAAGKPGGGADRGTWRFSTPVGFRTLPLVPKSSFFHPILQVIAVSYFWNKKLFWTLSRQSLERGGFWRPWVSEHRSSPCRSGGKPQPRPVGCGRIFFKQTQNS